MIARAPPNSSEYHCCQWDENEFTKDSCAENTSRDGGDRNCPGWKDGQRCGARSGDVRGIMAGATGPHEAQNKRRQSFATKRQTEWSRPVRQIYMTPGKAMRRRSRREPNTSEATGKTGREIPVNQPRPLSPSYLQEPAVSRTATEPRISEPRISERVPVPVPTATPVSSPELTARSAEDMSRSRNGRRPERRRSEARKSEGRKPERMAPEAAAPQRRMEVETQPESPAASSAGGALSSQEPKGFVVLTIGLPGSGKTTWYKRRGVTPLVLLWNFSGHIS